MVEKKIIVELLMATAVALGTTVAVLVLRRRGSRDGGSANRVDVAGPHRHGQQGQARAGSRLRQLPATRAFWFAWKGFYPETHLWRASR